MEESLILLLARAPVVVRHLALAAAALVVITLTACEQGRLQMPGDRPVQEEVRPNTLTEAEERGGWRLLFDGETFDGWRGLGRDAVPEGFWTIEDGAIKKVPQEEAPRGPDGEVRKGGDLTTADTYENFELTFDWKISPGGNSGLKYNVAERPGSHSALGFEYQVLDDERHPAAENPTHRAGALYDIIPPAEERLLHPAGTYNRSRIVFQDGHGEHWLNGTKLLEFDLGTARMDSALATSKFRDRAGFADQRDGHIVLQDHGSAAWYRNLKIRELPPQ